MTAFCSKRRAMSGALAIGLTLIGASSICMAASPGERLATRWCARCHAVKSGGSSPDKAAPSFADLAKDPSITQYTLRVFLQIEHPAMPNFILSSDAIDDLVAYITSLK